MADLPTMLTPTRNYKGTVILMATEIDLIEKMEVRLSDIWVMSYPKSGTTLVQEMVYLIATNLDFKTACEMQLDDRFPSLDINIPFRPYYRGVKYIDSLTSSPRFIKSHLHYHLLPESIHTVKPKIVYVARHPKDVFVSYYYFLKYLCALPEGTTLKQFYMACTYDMPLGSPWWKHVLDFWNHRNDGHILFLKYEDIIKDLPGTVRQIASFLGKDITNDDITKIAEHCSFQNMKNNDMVNLTYMAKYRKTDSADGNLLRKGKSGDWKEHGLPEMDMMDDVIREKLSPSGLSF